ncbi:MAG TPA: phasin family protein [Bacteroidales bacterium]|nr:phasin family protein [Bacteroidales bacterium]
MSELIKKTILAGLGAISLTREKAEEIAKDLINRGELAKNEEAKFIKDLLDIAEKNRSKLEEKIEDVVEKTLTRLDIPTRKEINELREEINRLSKKEDKA